MVMVDNGDAASIQNSDSSVTAVSSGKCLFFLQIELIAAHGRNNVKKKRFCSPEIEGERDLEDNKLCLVQWYEILNRQKLAVDRMDKELGS